MTIRRATAILVFTVLCVTVGHAATTYSFQEIGATFNVGGSNYATGINNLAQVSGFGAPNPLSPNTAFVWDTSQNLVTLPNPMGSGETRAYGINALGQVCGGLYVDPLLWTPQLLGYNTTQLGDINAPYGSLGVTALKINDYGSVVGNGSDGAHFYSQHAYLWHPNSANGTDGVLISLGGGTTTEDVTANSINDKGLVVGVRSEHSMLDPVVSTSRPFIWKPGVDNGTSGSMHLLNEFSTPSAAVAVNNFDQVVGRFTAGDGSAHAFIWTPSDSSDQTGTYIDLGGFSATSAGYNYAKDINDDGTVVGSATVMDGSLHAFVWTAASGIQDLNNLVNSHLPPGWTLSSATSINDVGMIVGNASYDPDGPGGIAAINRAFMLTPVPEPTLESFAAGFIGIFAWRRFQRR